MSCWSQSGTIVLFSFHDQNFDESDVPQPPSRPAEFNGPGRIHRPSSLASLRSGSTTDEYHSKSSVNYHPHPRLSLSRSKMTSSLIFWLDLSLGGEWAPFWAEWTVSTENIKHKTSASFFPRLLLRQLPGLFQTMEIPSLSGDFCNGSGGDRQAKISIFVPTCFNEG